MQTSVPLEPDRYYHIYNRGNNRENIFIEERNYYYFLRLYTKYIEPVAETFAYCLMRNHFHYFLTLIHYIHFNSQKHGFVEDFRTYPYSSYSAFLSTQPTRLKRQEVMNRFGDPRQFSNFHQKLADEKSIQHLVEDDAD